MTVQEIMNRAAALAGETPGEDADHEALTPLWVSVLMTECLAAENTFRLKEGRPTLDAAPEVTALTDTVPYAERLAAGVLPYGLALMYARDNGDDNREEKLEREYRYALTGASPCICRRIGGRYL